MTDLSIPNLLFIDLETSGLYRRDLDPNDPAQPWAPSIGALFCNRSGLVTSSFYHIIKPDGREVKAEALAKHGIPAQAAARIGIPEPRVLGILSDILKTASLTHMKVISYGDLDPKVISSLFAKFGDSQGKPGAYARHWEARPGLEFVNLMAPWCQQVCKLPSDFESGEFRWPKLDEAAEIILGRKPREGLHNAFEDVMILKDIFFALQDKGMFGPTEVAA